MGDSFHVRFQAKPDAIQAVLRALFNHTPQTVNELRRILDAAGQKTTTLDEQLNRLRKLGLVHKHQLQLTEEGGVCAQILLRQSALFYDLLHFYHYTLWNPGQPDVNRFSWTYRAVCKHLWSLHSGTVNKRALLELVMEELLTCFPDESSISISVDSIQGVLEWIRVLQPPVYDGKVFERRPFAAPELAILGIDRLYLRQGVAYGELLALDKEDFMEIATLCLVDDGVLDRMLKEAELRFPWFEVETGWGYFVRLYQPPDLTGDL